jgi:hypothetical protein
VGDGSGISVCRVERREIAGEVRREERKVDRCGKCVLARGWRVSIMISVSLILY